MNAPRTAVALAASLALAACSLTRSYPEPRRTFAVDPPPAAVAQSRRSEALRIGSVRVSPSFASEELVYRFDDVTFRSDFYNRLMAAPSAMLAARAGEWLERAGPFRFVAQPGSAVTTDYALELVFTDLYGDFRPGRAPAAVMSVQAYLVDTSGGTPKAAYTRAFAQRVDLGEASPEAVVRGYGVALGRILAELSADHAKLPAR